MLPRQSYCVDRLRLQTYLRPYGSSAVRQLRLFAAHSSARKMTDALQPLEDVTQISPTIVRILGSNPGKFTLQGTNTYLISPPADVDDASSLPCILIDTGEGVQGYTDSLRAVLQGKEQRLNSKATRTITDIILTHWHHDHVGGLPSVLALLCDLGQPSPRVHKYRDTPSDERTLSQLEDVPSKHVRHHSNDKTSSLLHPLADGDRISTLGGSDGKQSHLTVVHAPGHTTDHICLYAAEEGVLLTGDHVLGQGTSVFEDLGAYLLSLRKLLRLLGDAPSNKPHGGPLDGHLLPAHGPTVEDGKAAVQTYLDHRLAREEQILKLLGTRPPSEGGASRDMSKLKPAAWTIPEIVSTLYSEYPESLYPAASRGIYLHLRKLAMPDEEAIQRGAVPATTSDGQVHSGQRVRCVGADVGGDGHAPTGMPEDDAGWQCSMELHWSLVSDGEGADKRREVSSTATPSRGAL